MTFWYLGPGDEHPVVAEVKVRLSVYPVSNMFDNELAQRLRGWRRLRGEDSGEVWIDEGVLRDLGVA